MPYPVRETALDDQLLRVDYANSTTTYYGYAAPGSATTSAVWKIKRETLDSQGRTTAILYAGGSATYSQVWDDRASLSFS